MSSIWLIISFRIILLTLLIKVIGEKRIDLSYPIHSSKEAPEGPRSEEVAVITMLSNNIQYNILKLCTIIDSISPGKKKLILSGTYASRELLSILEGMIELTQFVNDE